MLYHHRKMPKRHLYLIVETAYAERIGARRLAVLTGYTPTYLRSIARLLGLPRLPRMTGTKAPSLRLINMITAVEHSHLYDAA